MFPTKTNFTPTDEHAYFDVPGLFTVILINLFCVRWLIASIIIKDIDSIISAVFGLLIVIVFSIITYNVIGVK